MVGKGQGKGKGNRNGKLKGKGRNAVTMHNLVTSMVQYLSKPKVPDSVALVISFLQAVKENRHQHSVNPVGHSKKIKIVFYI